MTYSDGEALILTRLRVMEQFDAGNSARAKWGILNSGAAAQYAILRPAPFENDYDSMDHAHVRTRWRTVIELWQRYVDDGTSAIALQELLQDTLEYLEGDPDFGGTEGAVYGYPAGGGDMLEVWQRNGDGPSWLKWELYVDWYEERAIA